MNIILYAPPAAGKGTLCEYLVKEYGYSVLSIGQVLRDARTPETEIGRIIIEKQDKGILVDDEIVFGALKQALSKLDGKVIIDGYPRSISQAKLLDTVFDNYIVINLSIDRTTAKKRAFGRVTCMDCGKIYNIYFENMKPKQNGKCDVCGSAIETRSDDNEDSFNTRFDVYEANKDSILDYYKNKLYVIDSSQSSLYINEQVDQILKG